MIELSAAAGSNGAKPKPFPFLSFTAPQVEFTIGTLPVAPGQSGEGLVDRGPEVIAFAREWGDAGPRSHVDVEDGAESIVLVMRSVGICCLLPGATSYEWLCQLRPGNEEIRDRRQGICSRSEDARRMQSEMRIPALTGCRHPGAPDTGGSWSLSHERCVLRSPKIAVDVKRSSYPISHSSASICSAPPLRSTQPPQRGSS